ncbi:MAG TPA: anaerobic ribonucleoside-triphosphate reductase activating protein [Albitalea sp.]|nr:anaerobic ribonucleoside-triphosphate reductase activating protein [Albitalea sp.]
MTAALRVGGLTPLTTIDFPGRLAAVVFLQGCSWRCGYCQNPELIPPEAATSHRWEDVIDFLQRRIGLLDGVVFSGGEPTLQGGLHDAVREVRELGFEVGLHTAGMVPQRLAALLPDLDWVGLDIKAPWDLLDGVSGVAGSAAKVRSALAHVVASGVAFECRTTWHAGLFALERLHELADLLARVGVTRWCLQTCRLDGRPQAAPPAADVQRLAARFHEFSLR